MAIETRKLTCINCPLGCQLSVVLDGVSIISVEGNSCPRGEAYGRSEVVDPQRAVTTTVRLDGSEEFRMLPVKTAGTVPKGMVRDVVRALSDVTAHVPIGIGDVIATDICGSGVNIVATRAAR